MPKLESLYLHILVLVKSSVKIWRCVNNNDSQLVFTYANANIVLEKKSVNLRELLDAKYTVKANNADYTFEFTFNDDGVSGTCKVTRKTTSSRDGVYSWTFDDSTNVITLTKISGKIAI